MPLCIRYSAEHRGYITLKELILQYREQQFFLQSRDQTGNIGFASHLVTTELFNLYLISQKQPQVRDKQIKCGCVPVKLMDTEI
jgi:hypothetical protein